MLEAETAPHEGAASPLATYVASFDADEYHESEGNVLADIASFARVCRVWCAAARELPLNFLAEQARKQRKVKQEWRYRTGDAEAFCLLARHSLRQTWY